MAALEASEISLQDATTGLNLVRLSVNPTVYQPYNLPVRGSLMQTLDGGVVRQVFGVHQQDMILNLEGFLTDTSTIQALLTKYRNPSNIQLLIDWIPNQFQVIFVPGSVSFSPEPIYGACVGFQYRMSLAVCTVIEFFGGDF
jgi:hypothetical protein